MAFDRKAWLNWKAKKPCPTCKTGKLYEPEKGGKLRSETAESLDWDAYGGNSYSNYVFSMHMKCDNCNETVVVSGYMSEENYPSGEDMEIQRSITPVSFYPAPHIIEIPSSCPKGIVKILKESFALFWLDVASCANKIRISIEMLLNEQGIDQTKTAKKGIEPLSLHARLGIFRKTKPDVARHLEAIKWIGNAGSHLSDIKSDDVLTAYELLEFSLEKLYNDRENRLIQLSDEINKAKKPVSKK